MSITCSQEKSSLALRNRTSEIRSQSKQKNKLLGWSWGAKTLLIYCIQKLLFSSFLHTPSSNFLAVTCSTVRVLRVSCYRSLEGELRSATATWISLLQCIKFNAASASFSSPTVGRIASTQICAPAGGQRKIASTEKEISTCQKGLSARLERRLYLLYFASEPGKYMCF